MKCRKKVVAWRELTFLCLQLDKEMRPSIDDVLEVLRKIESGKDKEAGEDGDEDINETLKNKGHMHALPVTSINFDKAKLFKSES